MLTRDQSAVANLVQYKRVQPSNGCSSVAVWHDVIVGPESGLHVGLCVTY